MTPNPAFERTATSALAVPSSLRSSAAGQCERWAATERVTRTPVGEQVAAMKAR